MGKLIAHFSEVVKINFFHCRHFDSLSGFVSTATLTVESFSCNDLITPNDQLKIECEKIKTKYEDALSESKTLKSQNQDLQEQLKASKQQRDDEHREFVQNLILLKEQKNQIVNLSANLSIYRNINTNYNKKISAQNITIQNFKSENQQLAADKERIEVDMYRMRADYNEVLQSSNVKSEKILRLEQRWDNVFRKFDPSVIRVMKGDIAKVKKYSLAAISKFSTLSLVGASKYELIRKVIDIPMPSYRTLQSMRSDIKVHPGYVQFAFDLLREKVKSLSGIDLECVLGFDETSISGKFVFDEKLGRIVSENSALAVQVRSMTDAFRQTIFFEFGKNLDEENLFDLIARLQELGVNVRAITSDSGPKNRTLWTALGCTEHDFFFYHNKMKIHVFTDMSHNLKLVRDHLLKDKFKLESGHVISGKAIIELMNRGEFGLLMKHVKPLKTRDKQNVSYALKVFNRKVTSKISETDEILANFMELVINYFDIFNLSVSSGNFLDASNKTRYFKILDEVSLVVGEARVSTKKGNFRKDMLPFQKSIIMSCESLKNIFGDLTKEYGDDIKIPTHVFSSDLLECFFGLIRGFAGNERNPSATQFLHRFKLLLVCKLDGVHASTNVSPSNHSDGDIASLLESILNRYKEEPEQEIDVDTIEMLKNIQNEPKLLSNVVYTPEESDAGGVKERIEYYMSSMSPEQFTKKYFFKKSVREISCTLAKEKLDVAMPRLKLIISNFCHQRAHKMEFDRQKANDKRNDTNTTLRRVNDNQLKRTREVVGNISADILEAPNKRRRVIKGAKVAKISNKSKITVAPKSRNDSQSQIVSENSINDRPRTRGRPKKTLTSIAESKSSDNQKMTRSQTLRASKLKKS